MENKKTIYNDQDYVMGKVVKEVFLEAWHGLCTFHVTRMLSNI
jgi:zinc finger SWIM domain-containing protein 3